MLKKCISALLVSALSMTAVNTASYADSTRFYDVTEKNWFYNAVEFVSDNGIMMGTSTTDFAPQNSVNKAMLVSTLYRNEGSPAVNSEKSFEDLPQNAYYTDAALWAVENGLLYGVRDNVLGIGWEITREEVAAIMQRYAAYKGIATGNAADTSALSFNDRAQISAWAGAGVNYCSESGILKGDTYGNFMPKATFKRAELAQVLYNIMTMENEVTASAQKVKNGAKAAVVFIHDDGGKATGRWLVKSMPKYNINGTVGIIGKSIDPEYNVNEPDNFEKWQVIIGDSDGRLNLAVHSHGHRYLGESDEAESGVLSDGTEYNYEKGHMTFDIASERERINQMFPDERLLAFIKPGTLWPEGKEQVSKAAFDMIKEHYIAMRNTGGGVDTLPPEDVYSVKSLMVRAADSYTETEDNQTSDFWIGHIDSAVEQNGVIVYLFHGVSDESPKGNTTSASRTEMLFSDMQRRIEKGEIWNGKFDEVMQYTQEFDAITKTEAKNYPFEGKMTVYLEDSISKIDADLTSEKFAGLDMFDYPITVKTELPYDWKYVKVSQEYNNRTEIVASFEEDGKRFVYANVVPDQSAAVLTKAEESEYVGMIFADGKEIEEFNPVKTYYKVVLANGTTEAPVITASNSDAEVEQAVLDENGEGSAFVTLGSLKYEVYFCQEEIGKVVYLRINPENDDENYTATRKIAELLANYGITANITDAEAYEALQESYDNIALCEDEAEDNAVFEVDDENTEAEGDFMPCYNKLVSSYSGAEAEKLVMTIHPEDKGDLYYSVIEDQIKYLILRNVKFSAE